MYISAVIYSELLLNGFTIFRSSEGFFGVLDKEFNLLIEARFDSIGYVPKVNWFHAVNFNRHQHHDNRTHFFLDIKGNLVKRLDDYYVLRIVDSGHIIASKQIEMKKSTLVFGLLSSIFEVKIPFMYASLTYMSHGLFSAKLNDVYFVVNEMNKSIFDAEIEEVLTQFEDEQAIIKSLGKYKVLNVSGEIVKELPFSHIFRASSNTYGAKNKEGIFKVLIDGSLRTHDIAFDDLTEFEGKWGIIDRNGNEVIPAEYDFIDPLRSPKYFKIFLGPIVFENDDFGKSILIGPKCGIIDCNQNFLIAPEYDWIEEISENLFAVNLGGSVTYNDEYQEDYWEAKGGKWGVINAEGKVIVPIQYGSLMLNWFQVKNYIFVQLNSSQFDRNAPYDVYDFDGNLIDDPQPFWKDHLFQP